MEKGSYRERVVEIFSGAAPTYGTIGPRHFSFFARELVEFVDVEAESDVLDVATGAGAVLAAVARRGARSGRLVGVDVVPEMLARAAAEFDDCAQRVELLPMDGERLDFADGTFDVVLCSFGLQAFCDKQAALIGFHRVLRDSGRIGLGFPLGWPFECDPRWRWQADVFKSFGALVERADDFTPRDVVPALRFAGFVEVAAREITCPLTFGDEEEWWAWLWSHGTRSLFEAVPPKRVRALRQELFDGLDDCKGADGLIRGSMSALVVRGVKSEG